MLFDPRAHETLVDAPWDEARVRAAVAEIVADAERAFTERDLWPRHPRDTDLEGEPPMATLYVGAAGVIWAFDRLQRSGVVELEREWTARPAQLYERYLAEPPYLEVGGGAIPSLWMGESGILLVAHSVDPSPWQEERLLACIHENVANPFWELMWGSPGTMLAAQVMYERTDDGHWADAWRASADRLWEEWREDVWLQNLYGEQFHVLGPPHGFAGNVYVLDRGGELLEAERRAELERRAKAAVARHAQRADGFAQWPPTLEPPWEPDTLRTQWCHGAPGIVASLATLAPDDDELTQLLLAGGELTWAAGPLVKGANLCHGTAGNGYAFLKLFERTGDELWLARARSFAMHAAEQVERDRGRFGLGHYTLWTGDLGAAFYLLGCAQASAAMPTLDSW